MRGALDRIAKAASQAEEVLNALDDEGEAEAVGAEKSPRKVWLFVLTLVSGIVIALGLVLLFFALPCARVEVIGQRARYQAMANVTNWSRCYAAYNPCG